MATDSIKVSDNSIHRTLRVSDDSVRRTIEVDTDDPNVSIDASDNSTERNVNSDSGSPYYVGARAYVTQTDYGAILTVIDKKGTTTADIYNGTDGTTIKIVRW